MTTSKLSLKPPAIQIDGECLVSDCRRSRYFAGVCLPCLRQMHGKQLNTLKELAHFDGDVCRRDGCEDDSYSRGLCKKHYSSASRAGMLDVIALPSSRGAHKATAPKATAPKATPTPTPDVPASGSGIAAMLEAGDRAVTELRAKRTTAMARADEYETKAQSWRSTVERLEAEERAVLEAQQLLRSAS